MGVVSSCPSAMVSRRACGEPAALPPATGKWGRGGARNRMLARLPKPALAFYRASVLSRGPMSAAGERRHPSVEQVGRFLTRCSHAATTQRPHEKPIARRDRDTFPQCRQTATRRRAETPWTSWRNTSPCSGSTSNGRCRWWVVHARSTCSGFGGPALTVNAIRDVNPERNWVTLHSQARFLIELLAGVLPCTWPRWWGLPPSAGMNTTCP